MFRIIAPLLVLVFASPALAEGCPDKFRFVDFGLEGRDGVIRRGGSILRAFDADGTHLLIPDRTVCRAVEEMGVDGRALPIPVVSSVDVDPVIADLDVTALRLMAVPDPVASGAANAVRHLGALALAGAGAVRGADHLCAAAPGPDGVSCQLLSPYPGNVPLVVYCDALTCEMPVLVRDDLLVISAAWRRSARDAQAVGDEISAMIRVIHAFFERQS